MPERGIQVQLYTDAVRFKGAGTTPESIVTVLPDSGVILGLYRPARQVIGSLIEVAQRYEELGGCDRPLLSRTQDVLYQALKNPGSIGVHKGQEDD